MQPNTGLNTWATLAPVLKVGTKRPFASHIPLHEIDIALRRAENPRLCIDAAYFIQALQNWDKRPRNISLRKRDVFVVAHDARLELSFSLLEKDDVLF